MRVRYATLPLAITLSCAIAACSNNDDDDGDGAVADDGTMQTTTPGVNPLDGTWRNACMPNPEQRDFRQVEITIAGSTFDFDNGFFADDACTTKTLQFDSTGTFTEQQMVDITNPGDIMPDSLAVEIDIEVSGITLTPLAGGASDQFNLEARCERTDWTPDVSVDIANCEDFTGTTIPRMLFDVYLLEGDVLYYGAVRGETPEERPAEPDFNNPYTRVVSME